MISLKLPFFHKTINVCTRLKNVFIRLLKQLFLVLSWEVIGDSASELKVDTKEGEFTIFRLQLPL